MPILFVHGVATRNDGPAYATRGQQIQALLRCFIAPQIAQDPEQVAISIAYWGDVGVHFAWEEASRPRGPLLGMGGDVESSPLEQFV